VRLVLALLAVIALGAAVVIGLGQAGTGADGESAPPFDLEAARQELAGAPAPLAGLHRQANQLLPADKRAFRRRLDELEGLPVVVNKWASWCGPCRAEFPMLQQQGVQHGRRIAFLGIDWRDGRSSAREFLDRHPLPFPSYEDPDGELAELLRVPTNIPVTVFIDERGEVAYMHQGGYRRAADLASDIDRYLRAP
jgi:thiol-disulfide isomerase/thioredoxin